MVTNEVLGVPLGPTPMTLESDSQIAHNVSRIVDLFSFIMILLLQHVKDT